MPSFDVVSRTDLMEVDNAINGVKREIKQRFDLAGTKCDIERVDNTLTMIADDTMKLTQVEGLLRGYLARRKVAKEHSNSRRHKMQPEEPSGSPYPLGKGLTST